MASSLKSKDQTPRISMASSLKSKDQTPRISMASSLKSKDRLLENYRFNNTNHTKIRVRSDDAPERQIFICMCPRTPYKLGFKFPELCKQRI
jgi:hypothetical protein